LVAWLTQCYCFALTFLFPFSFRFFSFFSSVKPDGTFLSSDFFVNENARVLSAVVDSSSNTFLFAAGEAGACMAYSLFFRSVPSLTSVLNSYFQRCEHSCRRIPCPNDRR
jgi:hypothetical protein